MREIEDVEPFEKRIDQFEVDDNLRELAKEVSSCEEVRRLRGL